MCAGVHSEEWVRYGGGRGFSFYITDPEVEEILLNSFPKGFLPYEVVPYKLVKSAKGDYRQVFTPMPIEAYLNKYREEEWNFFIWSKRIYNELHPNAEELVHRFCSIDGLPHITHRYIVKGKAHASSIDIVDKIEHKRTLCI